MAAIGRIRGNNRLAGTIVAVIALMLVQVTTLLHSETYGDEPHSHGGVQCLFVGGVFDDDLLATPALIIVAALAYVFAQTLAPTRQTVRVVSPKRHAPRAPPTL